MDRAGRQGMMRGAAQEAELHLKQAIAARFVANAPAQTSGVVFSGDTAFHYDCLLERGGFEPPRPFRTREEEFNPRVWRTYSARRKSVRAGENIFAVDLALLRISPVPF